MKQNVYDESTFFDGYSDLRKNNAGYNQYLEEPVVNKLLPDLDNLNILDIGCGFGDFSQVAMRGNAKKYLGIDISENMISYATKYKQSKVDFLNCAIEDYAYPENSYDLIIASLCLHYVKDISSVFDKVSKSLKKDGVFIFSVEHPICTSLLKGWYKTDNKTYWPIDNYFQESERKQNWFVDDVVKYHRTVSSYINSLIKYGLSLDKLVEPEPTEEHIEQNPNLKDHARRPALLITKSIKHS